MYIGKTRPELDSTEATPNHFLGRILSYVRKTWDGFHTLMELFTSFVPHLQPATWKSIDSWG